MGRTEYENLIRSAHMIRTMAGNLASYGQIERALRAIENANSIGSIVDPTAYRENAGKMHEDRDTLRAVLALARLGA